MNWVHPRHYSRKKIRISSGLGRLFEDLTYVAAILNPVLILPQLLKIWVEKSAAGVSFITWAGYFVGAIFWLVYGLVHREKPIIIANLGVGIFAGLIIVGILVYR